MSAQIGTCWELECLVRVHGKVPGQSGTSSSQVCLLQMECGLLLLELSFVVVPIRDREKEMVGLVFMVELHEKKR